MPSYTVAVAVAVAIAIAIAIVIVIVIVNEHISQTGQQDAPENIAAWK